MNNIKIFHQCGHNTKWNIESYLEDKVGNGLILSPSDYQKEKVIKLEDTIKENSMFDPQYYLPSSNKKNFETYDFFPNTFLESEYSTLNYEEIAYESAYKCVEFQKMNNFCNIVIPCIYKENYTEKILEIQKELMIIPFIRAIEKLEVKKPIYLSIVLKDSFLLDEQINKELLNFVTSFQSIDGVYIIPEHVETYKRIRNEKYLFELMKFIDKLVKNDLKVHVAYCDIEGFILSLANINSISIGAYENTRCFNIDKFRKSESRGQQGPNPRIFSRKLLQNVEYTYLASFEAMYDKYETLFEDNKYKVKLFQPTFQWHFTKPEIYKNYFCEYSKLLQDLPQNYEERYKYIIEKLREGMIYYKEINESGVLLDEKSDGGHLPHWMNAISMFNKYKNNN